MGIICSTPNAESLENAHQELHNTSPNGNARHSILLDDVRTLQAEINEVRNDLKRLQDGMPICDSNVQLSIGERTTLAKSDQDEIPLRPASVSIQETDTYQDLKRQVYSLSQALGKMQHSGSLDDLRHRLWQWRQARGSPAQEGIAASIRLLYVREHTLLVSDMSGFTRITKAEGVLHFLMLIKRMQAIAIPLMQFYGGTLVKTEADNLFVVFTSPKLALQAAMSCQAALRQYNTDKRENDQLHLSMSIVQGSMFHIPGVDVFGGVVPVGFTLGEDVAGKDETLVVEQVVESAGHLRKGMECIKFEKVAPFDHDGHMIDVWRATAETLPAPCVDPSAAPVLNSQVNAEELVEFVTLMDSRMRCPHDTEQIDARLRALFTETCAVLIIHLHFAEKEAEEEIDDSDLLRLESVLSFKEEAARRVIAHHGEVIRSMQIKTTPVVFVALPTSAAAFKAATEFAAFCQQSPIGDCNPSFGLAHGEILNIGNHNAFGDAVNVAFKLAEDIGAHGEILLDEGFVADIEANASAFGAPHRGWPLRDCTSETSGCVFKYKSLDWRSQEVQEYAQQLQSRVAANA